MIGIQIKSNAIYNLIYHNNIINNTTQSSDTNPGSNEWYHPELHEGNYWSDYLGLDDGSGLDKHTIAGDGIGDTEIPWPAAGYDFYPYTDVNGWLNRDPIADSGPDLIVECTSFCCSEVTLDGSASSDPDGDDLSYTWSENGEVLAGPTTNPISTVDLAFGEHMIVLTIDDGKGGTDTDDLLVNIVDTTPPEIVEISAPVDPVEVETEIAANATFSDACGSPHTATWQWGDADTTAGVVTEPGENELGSVTGTHIYTVPGVYTVTLTLTDNFENSLQSIFQFVVVYDPEGSFVTGGGWIDSPEGAYTPDPSLTGKANFGFVSKYKQGQSTPDGNTQFNFKVADLKFSSTSYDWLVIAGPNAKYKGSGTINDDGDYGFMLTARDGQINGGGGVDKFRIKIWDKDEDETVVYDNQLGAEDDADATDEIEGGSIVIHNSGLAKPMAGNGLEMINSLIIPKTYSLSQNYPNPFNPVTTIGFSLPKAGYVTIEIYNILGEKVKNLVSQHLEAGEYRYRWDAGNLPSGMYFYHIRTKSFLKTKRLILVK